MSVNSGLKVTKIIGQGKAFYRQRIPEFSCARKETVDIDILATSRNGDTKIIQSIRITSRPPEINKPLLTSVHTLSYIRFNFRSQFRLLPQIRYRSHLE